MKTQFQTYAVFSYLLHNNVLCHKLYNDKSNALLCQTINAP